MPRGQLTSPLHAHIEKAAIEAFIEGAPYSQRALADRIAAAAGKDAEHFSRNLTPCLRRLEKRGEYVAQPAAFGGKMMGGGAGGTSPRIFNSARLALDISGLEVAARAYLAEPSIPESRKSAARSALRLVFGLPTKCTDQAIIRACTRVSNDDLYGLARSAFDCAIARELGRQTAKNHRTAVRQILRYALENRLIPIVFPPYRSGSEWLELQNRYHPLNPTGRTADHILTMRGAWRALESGMRDIFGDECGFHDLTREMAETIASHLIGSRRNNLGYIVRRLLRELARVHHVGPFAGSSDMDVFRVQAGTQLRPALYLRGRDGDAADGDLDGLCRILTDLGFPPSLTEFLLWYREYVTLPPLQMLSDSRFPARRSRHRIADNTLFERLTALRAILGAAIYELPIGGGTTVGLRLDPRQVTPEVLFGPHFPALVDAMIEWWSARGRNLPEQALGKGTSGALRQMVINLGMLALGQYERLRHVRGLRTATRKTSGGDEALDSIVEESVTKSADETGAWEAYLHANRVADALTDLATDRKGRSRKRTNEFRDIRKILKATPPAWWIHLLNSLITRVREEKARGADGYAYHALILDTVTLGLLVSTGMRIDELSLVRLDVQFRRGERIVVLRAIDRKNAKPHMCLVHTEYLPDDVLDEYLEYSRPWFMRQREPSARRDAQPAWSHEFVMVSTSGRPYASVTETPDGGNRDSRAMKRRAGQHGKRFQARMAAHARVAGLPVPAGKFDFGPHTVRGSCGYGIFLRLNEQAAAQYLGDTVDTARDAYSAIDGAHVDSSCLVGFEVGLKKPPTSVERPLAKDYAAELQELVANLKEGLLTRDEFDRAKAALSRRAAWTAADAA